MCDKMRRQIKLPVPVSKREAEHDYFTCFLKSKADLKKDLLIPLKDASILVIGCGYLYPEVLLYSTCAKKVVGIDVKECFWRDGLLKKVLTSSKKHKGHKKIVFALNDTFRNRFLVKQNYYGRLERFLGTRVNHDNFELVSYKGKRIPFHDNAFDLVISNAVLEHVMEISAAIKEMARVTNEIGINYHLYHNYYSFSGNHKPYALNKKHPWGHLRGLIQTNLTHLNKAKIYELEKTFLSFFNDVEIFAVDTKHFKRGVDEQFDWEEEALFQRYKKELEQKYPPEMLLSRGFLIVGKNKVSS